MRIIPFLKIKNREKHVWRRSSWKTMAIFNTTMLDYSVTMEFTFLAWVVAWASTGATAPPTPLPASAYRPPIWPPLAAPGRWSIPALWSASQRALGLERNWRAASSWWHPARVVHCWPRPAWLARTVAMSPRETPSELNKIGKFYVT